MLRALLEYAERRSTFVTEYADSYYLAPTEAEWEQLQDVVAETQENLVACTDIESLLAELLECCRNTQASLWPGGGQLADQRDYDDYQSSVEHEVGDPPAEFADWPAWVSYKCKAAQKIVDDIDSLGNKLEVWYSAGAAITFAVFQTMVLGTAVAPPIALVLAIVSTLAVAGTAAAMIAFQAWVQEHKSNLVCAIHQSDTEQDAYDAVQQYINDNWDLVLAPQFGEALFSHDVISKCFDGGLDVTAYSDLYCTVCATDPLNHRWDFPPDTDWAVSPPDSTYDAEGNLYLQFGGEAFSPSFAPGAGVFDIGIEATGCDDGGGIVSVCYIQGSNNLVDWFDVDSINMEHPTCPTLGDAGGVLEGVNFTYPYARYRVQAVPGHGVEYHDFVGQWTPVP